LKEGRGQKTSASDLDFWLSGPGLRLTQVLIISDNEDTLQRALHELNKIILDYNFEISIHKTKQKWHSVVNGR
jgi:hypothetical protein